MTIIYKFKSPRDMYLYYKYNKPIPKPTSQMVATWKATLQTTKDHFKLSFKHQKTVLHITPEYDFNFSTPGIKSVAVKPIRIVNRHDSSTN